MGKKKKHIDDLFREKVGDYSEVPPSDAWLDMDKKLDTLVPHAPPGNPFRWLGHIGIVSLIAVLGVSVINKFTGKNNNSQTADNIQYINKLGTITESNSEDKNTTQPQPVNVPSIIQEEVNTNSIPHPMRHDDALAFGESYSENADKEYIEGFTEIKKEGYEQYQGVNAPPRNCIAQLQEPENNNFNTLSGKIENIENQHINNITEQSKEANTNSPKVVKEVENKSLAMAKNADNTRIARSNFERWELGAKAGYERGFNNTAAKGFTVAPYITYNITEKLGIMVQPTAKYANAPTRNIGNSVSYYKTNGDVSVTPVESFVTSNIEGINIIYYNNTKFRYSQAYDSIVKTNTTGSKYVQFELPVLVSYKMGSKVAIYGGVNTVYSQLQTVTEHTYTKVGTKTADVLVRSRETPVAPPSSNVITHNGRPYSEYNGPVYPADHENNFRVGAMVGVNYEYSNRWLIDAMVQKTPTPANVKSGYNVNAPLSVPSFRLSVGYKIKK